MTACNAGPYRLAETTRDAFLGGRLILEQPKSGYRAGQDPVLLAAATPIKPGQSFVDLGCGVGTIGLCLGQRVANIQGLGLELDPDLAALGQRNIERNVQQADLRILEEDMLQAPPQPCDWALSNPPFFAAGSGRPSPNAQRQQGRHGQVSLSTWLLALGAWVKPRGYMGLVLSSGQLAEAIQALGGGPHNFGGFVIKPLLGKVDRQVAERCLLFARQGSRSDTVLAKPLAIRDRQGELTPEARQILDGGAALDLPPIR